MQSVGGATEPGRAGTIFVPCGGVRTIERRRRVRPWWAAALAGGLAALGAAAAWEADADRAGEIPAGARPLVDARHAPELLVESRRIRRPPSTAGNRYLTGWSPKVEDRWLRLVPDGGGARLELVHLERRRRRLALDFTAGKSLPTGIVRASLGGRELAAVPLGHPLELALPADLPLGRVTLDLAWELPAGAEPPAVRLAGVRPALPAGKAVTRGGDVLQTGASLVELVRPVAGGETLVGSFAPPRWPRRGEFELSVERDGGALAGRFTHRPSWLDLFRRSRAVRVPVGEAPGFVKVRLLARRGAAAGRWEGLALAAAPGAARDQASADRRASARSPTADPRVDRHRGTIVPAAWRPRESGAVARTAAAGAPAAPPRLVVVYAMDALRADHVGHLGGPPELTPTLDRLAAEGRAYRRHRSVAPNTLPSTKALFGGRIALSAGDARLPPGGPTLAERFRAAGYRTALFSGNVFVSPAFGMERGFDHVAGEVLLGPDQAGEGAGSAAGFNDNAERVHTAALAWLTALPPGERAFLYLHVIHPHNPYDPPPPFRRRFAGDTASRIGGGTDTLVAVRKGRRPLSPADRRRLAGLYAGGLAYNDAELAVLLSELAALVPPAETLLALTSDHGEELFEHGGVLHGYTLYEEMLRIPAVLWSPGRVSPGTVERPTDTLDLRRAILRLAGLPAEPRAPAPPPEPEVHFAAAASLGGGIYSAQTSRWKVIWAPRRGAMWGQGEGIGRSRDPEYAFDLAADPGETVNRAGDAPLEAAWLRQRLLAWVKSDPKAGRIDAKIDEETRAKLRALGYLR